MYLRHIHHMITLRLRMSRVSLCSVSVARLSYLERGRCFYTGLRAFVGVLVVGNPGLGLLNDHRPAVCNARAFSAFLATLRKSCPRIGLVCCRDGRRKNVVSALRRCHADISNVIVGTKTCARADITVTSYVHSLTIPIVRIRVSGVFTHRRCHRRSFLSPMYTNAVYKLKLVNCGLTVSTVLCSRQ